MLKGETRRQNVNEFNDKPKVKSFLDSIGRNSIKTKNAYLAGIRHFENFIAQSFTQEQNQKYNCETILEPLANNTINVYELLDSFVSTLQDRNPNTIRLYVAAIRSYLAYHDIDVLPSKFKRKVKMPKNYRQDEKAIDASDIRKILLGCNNRRLKVALLVLASGGMRTIEAFAIRNMDIDFNTKPTKIWLRPEFSKTKVGRDVYISDEATDYLKQWMDWKYKNPNVKRIYDEQDLVFGINKDTVVNSIYCQVWKEFDKLLRSLKMDKRKEVAGIQKRKEITAHSLRRFCKTAVSDQAGQDYSEWFLGHAKSPYWTKKEEARREIYQTNNMKYLTFLDYQILETTGKNIEKQLLEKDRQIENLKEMDKIKSEELQLMNERMKKIELEYQLASKKFTQLDSMFNRLEADERNNRNRDHMNS